MSKTVITLTLDGHPSLEDYVNAISGFGGLLKQLSKGAPILWEVDDLEMGSTVTSVVGISEDEEVVSNIRTRFLDIVKDYNIDPSTVDKAYDREAKKLFDVLNDRVPTMRIETDQDDITIDCKSQSHEPELEIGTSSNSLVLGAVEGRIQTLSNRGSLRFTLYDLIFDKAVSCYLKPGEEDIIRDAWGQISAVEGLVKRDNVTGRPLIVRQVTNIRVLEKADPNAWRQAAGVLGSFSDEPAEVTIRRLRDA